MGVDDFIYMPQPYDAPHSESVYLPDYIVNPHPRFAALTNNIRQRRGSKVDIHMPLYRDINTPEFLRDENKGSNSSSSLAVPVSAPEKMSPKLTGDKPVFSLEPDTDIHMDAMGFGMGMCCLVSI